MHTFRLTNSVRDGWQIELVDVPLWAHLAERFGNEMLCPGTGHLFCNPPEWAWKIGWGKRDPDGDFAYLHSLGSVFYGKLSDLVSLTDKRVRRTVTIPVSVEHARRWDPEFVAEIEALHDDSDDLSVSADAARWRPGQ